jgi:DNA-binding response OmpR family regulator
VHGTPLATVSNGDGKPDCSGDSQDIRRPEGTRMHNMMHKRILIVEDDRHSRKGLQDCLLAEGHGVEAVPDGWQAFRKIKEGAFDLAIVDLDLPSVMGVVMSGWDVVRILRAYFLEVPIIMVSAQEDQAIHRLIERFKVSAFMVKPIDPARVKSIVRGLGPAASQLPAVECIIG